MSTDAHGTSVDLIGPCSTEHFTIVAQKIEAVWSFFRVTRALMWTIVGFLYFFLYISRLGNQLLKVKIILHL